MMYCFANSNVGFIVRAKRSSCFMKENLIVLNSSVFSAFESLFSFNRPAEASWTASTSALQRACSLPRSSSFSSSASFAALSSACFFSSSSFSLSYFSFLFAFSSSSSTLSIRAALLESLPFTFQSNNGSSSGKGGRPALCSRYLVNKVTSTFSSVTQRLLLLHRECIFS
jgi:hypothetical protein